MFLRAVLVLLACSTGISAHGGEALEPHDLWTAWRFDPGTTIPLLVTAALYARGARRSRGIARREMVLFWMGWMTLALALVSPLHPLGEVLFSAHMAQHEILILVAAPLMVLSRPLVPLLWGLPFGARRRAGQAAKTNAVQSFWRWVTAPLSAWLIHGVALWAWHVPSLFEATLTNEWVHAAQHTSFFLSALLFWWSLLYARGRHGYGSAVVYVFTTGLHTSILGALLTFSRVPWYPAYQSSVAAWGLTVLEDQQVGGLIMWVPAGLVYVIAGLALFGAWMRQSDRVMDYAS